jgi:hypothetical protein
MLDTRSDGREDAGKEQATASVLAAARVGYLTSEYAQLTKRESVRALTQEAWLACSDPLAMLCFLHGRASGRKFRLFVAAVSRRDPGGGGSDVRRFGIRA